jgi:small subunit ribosomal protein S3e
MQEIFRHKKATVVKKWITRGLIYTELNDFLYNELLDDGYSGVEVRFTKQRIELIIRASRPKSVLGEKGRRIRELQKVIAKRFGFDEGSVECFAERLNNRGLCCSSQAASLGFKILHGLEIKRAAIGVLRFIMDNNARACQIIVSGKIAGERAKALKFCDGYISHTGNPLDTMIETATHSVTLRAGVVGIKVTILKPFKYIPNQSKVTPPPDYIKYLPQPTPKEVLPLTFSYTGFKPIGKDWNPTMLRFPNAIDEKLKEQKINPTGKEATGKEATGKEATGKEAEGKEAEGKDKEKNNKRQKNKKVNAR